VSPPFHDNYEFDIVGWEFRNENNTGPNDGSVNAPQEDREFNFVFSREGLLVEQNEYSCANWNFGCLGAKQSLANSTNDGEVPRSRGHLTITDIQLGNLVPNSKAWIESMKFEVTFYLPEE
jgi:hypothetical protein